MDHHRPVRAIVGADIFQVEAFGQVVIELHGAKLPFPADAVADHEVDLRAVERGFPLLGCVVHAQALDDLHQSLLGRVPVFVAADVLGALRIAQADANAVIAQAETFQDEQHQLDVGPHFRFDLVGANEQVGVVLGEAPHTRHAVQLAGLLEAIDGAELGQTNRQIAVTALIGLVNLNVVRTVHRFEKIAFLVLEPGEQGVGPLLGRGRLVVVGQQHVA